MNLKIIKLIVINIIIVNYFNYALSSELIIPKNKPFNATDLIEELIRIKGFKNIKLVEPVRKREKETLNFKQKLFHLSQRSLASKGYLETVTWSFTDSKIDKQFSKGEKEVAILLNNKYENYKFMKNSLIYLIFYKLYLQIYLDNHI